VTGIVACAAAEMSAAKGMLALIMLSRCALRPIEQWTRLICERYARHAITDRIVSAPKSTRRGSKNTRRGLTNRCTAMI
jgi:hypothetical protein